MNVPPLCTVAVSARAQTPRPRLPRKYPLRNELRRTTFCAGADPDRNARSPPAAPPWRRNRRRLGGRQARRLGRRDSPARRGERGQSDQPSPASRLASTVVRGRVLGALVRAGQRIVLDQIQARNKSRPPCKRPTARRCPRKPSRETRGRTTGFRSGGRSPERAVRDRIDRRRQPQAEREHRLAPARTDDRIFQPGRPAGRPRPAGVAENPVGHRSQLQSGIVASAVRPGRGTLGQHPVAQAEIASGSTLTTHDADHHQFEIPLDPGNSPQPIAGQRHRQDPGRRRRRCCRGQSGGIPSAPRRPRTGVNVRTSGTNRASTIALPPCRS